MEEMSLIIAVNVPYEVEITATGIPIHEAKVEFCIPKNKLSYNYPAKMVTDNKFVFTLTNELDGLVNSTHDYKLYVYYGNARFEADTGSFNLVDEKAFDVKMNSDKSAESLADKLMDKVAKRPTTKDKKVKEPEVTATVEVTSTPEVTETVDATDTIVTPTVAATKPTPTPTVTLTTTVKETKNALKDYVTKKTTKKTTKKPVKESVEDANQRVKDILSSINKTATPSVEMNTPEVTKDAPVVETQESGKFFEEIERMRNINETRKTNKKVKDAIRNTTKKK